MRSVIFKLFSFLLSAAVQLSDQPTADTCCACYELTVASGPALGKRLIVQATNDASRTQNSDYNGNHFVLAIPAGGERYRMQGCVRQWKAPSEGWNEGEEHTRAHCDHLPEPLREGCRWRFDWLNGWYMPQVTYRKVTCPRELTERSGCQRADDV